MGMAAGQARLLSITSRMSDNELRAQIINNNKLRLATESSQVSEAYVNALNNAQLMFTNYDSNNNASYQQLTFNSMTNYNPYNNQYGLSNASGQILVSEQDAKNYQNANGSLEKFVSYYGLEYNSTYFDDTSFTLDSSGKVQYMTGNMNDDGTNEMFSTGLTGDELRAYYEGINGSSIHPGYASTIASPEYYAFQSALTNFDSAYTSYSEKLSSNIEAEYSKFMKSDLLDQIENIDEETTADDISNIIDSLGGVIDSCKTYAGDTSDIKFFDDLIAETESIKGRSFNQSNSEVKLGTDASGNYIELNDSKNDLELGIEDCDTVFRIYKNPDENADNPYIVKLYYIDEKTNELVEDTTRKGEYDQEKNAVLIKEPQEDGTDKTSATYSINSIDVAGKTSIDDIFEDEDLWKSYNTASSFNIKSEYDLTDFEYIKEILSSIVNSLDEGIYAHWDSAKFAPEKDTTEYKAYVSAAAELLKSFGYDVKTDSTGAPVFDTNNNFLDIHGNSICAFDEIPNLVDLDYVWEKLGQAGGNMQSNFQPIYDVIILDRVFNTYGEPKYTWIDTNNQNENGEAKYQWYANLFERMGNGTKDNYKVLQDGLASSSEWIQFALESGLVTMEQVDSNSTWNTLSYSNCSDITEQTNNAAVTIAEAEYNAAMNKIENKDKKYDLELKNIDTEHNSLQTEYDSIKTAIDKNIERTFKIYS